MAKTTVTDNLLRVMIKAQLRQLELSEEHAELLARIAGLLEQLTVDRAPGAAEARTSRHN